MADRTSQDRNFSVGIPALPGSRSRSGQTEHPDVEDLRLVILGHYAIFVAILTCIVPQVFRSMGYEALSTVSMALLFVGFVVVGWKMFNSFIRVARAAAERLYDER